METGQEIDLVFRAEIQEDWYLYSTDFDPDLGPMVTEFRFVPDASYTLVGGIRAVGAKEKYDELWGGLYTYFTGKAEFRQTIKVLGQPLVIKGHYAYQACSDVGGKCIPFEEGFEFSGLTVKESKEGREAREARPETPERTGAYPEKKGEAKTGPKTGTRDKGLEKGKQGSPVKVASARAKAGPFQNTPNSPYALLGFMVLAFLGGLAALFTPCVFPMVPMTVTFFTSRSKDRKGAVAKAVVYGLSIVALYVLSGTVVALVNGPGFAHWLSTHWVPNVFFFAVFLCFGLSFLGFFEITLPGRLVNNVDRESDRGGYYGVFFMAFTLVLVSFSCTAPIVGSILVEAAGGMVLKPVLGMFSFSLALAVPFALFAVFPEWLGSLPRSGGWLNSVKVCLGFLELALSLKFLGVADQVYHWGVLDREAYLVLWAVTSCFLGLYLLGKIRLPHDGAVERIGALRLLLSMAAFGFALYLVPGLFGAPLKALAGYLPPMSGQDFNLPGIGAPGSPASGERGNSLCGEPKYSGFLSLPHGLNGYFDLGQALDCAREQGKPLFLGFTGHGCVNCREMEARVWSAPEVLSRLKRDYVVAALYVDEKTELPEKEWYRSTFDGKVKKTVGAQNADYQAARFNNNAQPYYAVLDPYTGETLTGPMAYDLDVGNFVRFLEAGARAMERQVQEIKEAGEGDRKATGRPRSQTIH